MYVSIKFYFKINNKNIKKEVNIMHLVKNIIQDETQKQLDEKYEGIAYRLASRYKIPETTMVKLVYDFISELNGIGERKIIQPSLIKTDAYFDFKIKEIKDKITESKIVESIILSLENFTNTKCYRNTGSFMNQYERRSFGKRYICHEVQCLKYGRADLVTNNAIIEVKPYLNIGDVNRAIGQLKGYSLGISGKRLIIAGLIVDSCLDQVKKLAANNNVSIMGLVYTSDIPKNRKTPKWHRILF